VELQFDLHDHHSGQLASTTGPSMRWRVLVESPLLAVRGDANGARSRSSSPMRKRVPERSPSPIPAPAATHIGSVALFKAAAADVADIPYGAGQVVPNLLGGRIDATCSCPARSPRTSDPVRCARWPR
jgi:tripartite-type tricarboxylate transporter receptor subunit TctC